MLEARKTRDTALALARQREITNLISQLADKDFSVRFRAAFSLQTLQLPPETGIPLFQGILVHSAVEARLAAAKSLGAYGGLASKAVPLLIARLQFPEEEESVRTEVVRALRAIDPRLEYEGTLQALANAVPKAGADLATAIAESFGEFGVRAKTARPVLLDLLKHWSPVVQFAAFMALGKINGEVASLNLEVVRNILRQSEVTQAETLSSAFLTLQKFPLVALPAMPELIAIVQTTDKGYLKLAAIETIGKIGPGSNSQSVSLLLQLAGERNVDLATAASKALGAIRNGDIEAVVPLKAALLVESKRVREHAANALARIGPGASSAAESLARALTLELKSPQPIRTNVAAIAEALVTFGRRGANSADAVFALLIQSASLTNKSDVSWLRPYLFAIVAAIGVPPTEARRQEAVLLIQNALKTKDPYLFGAAARLARTLGPGAMSVTPLLMTALERNFGDTMMSHLFRPTMMAVPFPTFKDRSFLDNHTHGDNQDHALTTARIEAMRALAAIGGGAAPAVPLLRVYTESRDESTDSFYREDARKAVLAIEGSIAPNKRAAALERALTNARITEISGRTYKFSEWNNRICLFIFVDARCPCVQSYGARITALAKQHKALLIVYVFTDTDEVEAKTRNFFARHKPSWMLVADQNQVLTKLFDAQNTTECFLFDTVGALRYHGRIDDNAFNPSEAKQHNLADAVAAVIRNKPVLQPETIAKGCAIARRA